MKKLLIGLTLLTSFSSIAGENYFTKHSNGGDFFDVNIPAFTMLKTDRELLPESVSVSYSIVKRNKSSFILSSFTIHEDGAQPLNNNKQHEFSVLKQNVISAAQILCELHDGSLSGSDAVKSRMKWEVIGTTLDSNDTKNGGVAFGIITNALSYEVVNASDSKYQTKVFDIQSIECLNH